MGDAIFPALIAAIFLVWAGVLFCKPGERWWGFGLSLCGISLLVFAGFNLFDASTPAMAADAGETKLTENGIYETVCSAQVGEQWAVILRDQDGKLLSYLLPAEPPKIWKRTVHDGKPQYQPFPGSQ